MMERSDPFAAVVEIDAVFDENEACFAAFFLDFVDGAALGLVLREFETEQESRTADAEKRVVRRFPDFTFHTFRSYSRTVYIFSVGNDASAGEDDFFLAIDSDEAVRSTQGNRMAVDFELQGIGDIGVASSGGTYNMVGFAVGEEAEDDRCEVGNSFHTFRSHSRITDRLAIAIEFILERMGDENFHEPLLLMEGGKT